MEKTIDKAVFKRGELTGLVRDMEVGDVIRFPITKHNTVRNLPYHLVAQRAEGKCWRVSADLPNKQSVITRVS